MEKNKQIEMNIPNASAFLCMLAERLGVTVTGRRSRSRRAPPEALRRDGYRGRWPLTRQPRDARARTVGHPVRGQGCPSPGRPAGAAHCGGCQADSELIIARAAGARGDRAAGVRVLRRLAQWIAAA
jgi:hypothetical protein